MDHEFNWKKDTLDSKYQIFSKGLLKYALNFESWHNSAIATTQNGIFLFKTQTFGNTETLLVDNKNVVLAAIKFNITSFNAVVKFTDGGEFKFVYQRNRITEWSLNNGLDKQVFYRANTGSGLVKSNIDNELIILTGLYIREYYSRLLFFFLGLVLVALLVQNAF